MRALTRRTFLAAATLPAAAHAGCRLEPAATIRLRAIDGFPVIDAAIAGTPVTFLLDTGAQAHLVVPEAAAAFHLPLLPGAVPLIGTGGARPAPIISLAGVSLGAVQLDPAPTPVARLPPAVPRMTPMLAGILGAKLLDRFDLLLDVQAGQLGLYEAAGCNAALPALAPRMTVIGLTVLPDRQALLPVTVDGQVIPALLDTGSRATLLTADAAARLGLHAPDSANVARGVDGESLPVAHTSVRTMAVGDDLRHDVPVSIAPLRLGPADMLLGFDYLRQRRVWISYVTARLVIAPLGEQPAPAPSGPGSPAPPPPGPPPP